MIYIISIFSTLTLMMFTSSVSFAQPMNAQDVPDVVPEAAQIEESPAHSPPETTPVESTSANGDVAIGVATPQDVNSVRQSTQPLREDPFEPPKSILAEVVVEKKGEIQKNLSDLERYNLSELKLVGVLWNVNTPKALIKIPSGSTYVVFRKTKIGNNNGYVSNILEGAVEVTEIVYDEFEGKKYKEVRFIEFDKNQKKVVSGQTATITDAEIRGSENSLKNKKARKPEFDGGDDQ